MDIVAHARTVTRGIVIARDRNKRTLTQRHDEEAKRAVREEVRSLAGRFPLYA